MLSTARSPKLASNCPGNSGSVTDETKTVRVPKVGQNRPAFVHALDWHNFRSDN
jgi:hypothetical protein